jgi:hypothetical protein
MVFFLCVWTAQTAAREGSGMSKPYDASPKDLITEYPADWLAFVGAWTWGSVEAIDADVFTATATAAKVLRVQGPELWLVHVELQSSSRTNRAEALQWHKTLLRYRHGCPVRTVLVLLRRQADSPQLNGVCHDEIGDESHQLLLQIGHGSKVPPADDLAHDHAEDDLNLVQPRHMLRQEHEADAMAALAQKLPTARLRAQHAAFAFFSPNPARSRRS